MIKAKIVYGDRCEDYIPIMGGMSECYRWRKFLNGWLKEFRPYIVAVKNALLEADLVPSYGMQCSNDIMFEFSDGHKPVAFSMRAWGDLISAIAGKKEGYMMYY